MNHLCPLLSDFPDVTAPREYVVCYSLGALTFKGGVTSADNITTPGIYYDTTTDDVFIGYQCYIFHLKVGNYGDMQIAVAYYGTGIKTRIKGGPWNDV